MLLLFCRTCLFGSVNQLFLYSEYGHTDYLEQFLNEQKTHPPHLSAKTIHYDQLIIVSLNLTKDPTRPNCTAVRQLITGKILALSNDNYLSLHFLTNPFFLTISFIRRNLLVYSSIVLHIKQQRDLCFLLMQFSSTLLHKNDSNQECRGRNRNI